MQESTLHSSRSERTNQHALHPVRTPVILYIAAFIVHALCIVQIARNSQLAPAVLPWAEAVSAVGTAVAVSFASRLPQAAHFRAVWAVDACGSVLPLVLVAVLQSAGSDVRRELFGFAYAGFAFLKAAALILALTGILRNGGIVHARSVFVATLLFYVVVTPWAAFDCGTTGDEPHYLLLAH